VIAGLLVGALLASGTAWGAIEVRGAYHAHVPAVIERAARLRLVAVDVEIEERVAGVFAPREVAIGGRAPALIVRLTAAGEPADARDPVFDRAGEPIRLLLVAALPLARDRVAVQYAGAEVGSVAIGDGGPRIPVPSVRATAAAQAGRAPLEGHARFRLLLEARDWSRVADPHGVPISYRLAGIDKLAEPDHWIEVDGALAPLSISPGGRPFIEPVRRFVVEYWLIEGGRPLALAGRSLPAEPLVVPPAAEAALARAQPDLDASHYQIEGP
jgi:hypothetical protein